MIAARTAAAAALALATIGCQRSARLQCYPVDPHSPVVWSQVEDPIRFSTDDYCGRGASEREALKRHLTAFCVPRPDDGCDACAFDIDEVEDRLRAEIADDFEQVGCPSDYEPEEIVHGCVAEWVETDACCWAAEYFTDPGICDPGGSGQLP
jgi:hypothetical protein